MVKAVLSVLFHEFLHEFGVIQIVACSYVC